MTSKTSAERRRWPREAVNLHAQYFVKNQSTRYQDCKIINISRNGAAVVFPKLEFLKEQFQVFLDVMVPKSFQQLTFRGEIRIRYRESGGVVGGIQFDSLVAEPVFNKLIAGEKNKN
jgi:hypothetical protein